MATAKKYTHRPENVESANNLPTFLQQANYMLNGAVCQPLSFIATKEKDRTVLSPFSFVALSKYKN